MNRDPILIRVDGTTQSGWEGLYRCITLAGAIQRRRRPTYFLSQVEPAPLLAQTIKRKGHEWLEADAPVGTDEDLTEMIQEIRRLRPAAVVVDAPDVSEEYLKELVSTGTLVVSLDSSANLRFPSHLVINPLLEPGREAYDFHSGTQLLLGPRYAIVRPEVRRVRPIRAMEPPQPSPNTYRALIALGDDDPNHQTLKLAKQLLHISKLEKIDLAVRLQHPDLAPLQALAESNPQRLSVATEPAQIASRLSRCHFAITAGNGWAMELACIGVPQLIVVQQETHWHTAQRLEDEGVATCLGRQEDVSPAALRQQILDLLGDPLDRQAMARCGRKFIDGRGPDRLVTALEILLHPSRQLDFDFQQAA